MKFVLIIALLTLPFTALGAEKSRKPSSEDQVCGKVKRIGYDGYPYAEIMNGSTLKLVTVVFRTGNREQLQTALSAAQASLASGGVIRLCVEADKSNLDAAEITLSNGTRFSASASSGMKK